MLKWIDTELIAWGMVVVLAIVVAAQTVRTAYTGHSEDIVRQLVANDQDQSNEIHAYWSSRCREMQKEIDGHKERVAELEELLAAHGITVAP